MRSGDQRFHTGARRETRVRVLEPIFALLFVAAAASVPVVVGAAAEGNQALSALAAGAFAVIALGSAVRINADPWRKDRPATLAAEASTLARNTRLTALIYAWGATVMLAVYTLSGLKWQHGWQYGSSMALVAAGLYGYAALLSRESSTMRASAALRRIRALTVVHAIAAAAGLTFLVVAGKLWAGKSDWAANHVFMAGGLAVIGVCVISALTQHRLSPPR